MTSKVRIYIQSLGAISCTARVAIIIYVYNTRNVLCAGMVSVRGCGRWFGLRVFRV